MKAKNLLWLYEQGERDFAGADLCGADLRGAILIGVNLKGANLRGADFTRAFLISTSQVSPFKVDSY